MDVQVQRPGFRGRPRRGPGGGAPLGRRNSPLQGGEFFAPNSVEALGVLKAIVIKNRCLIEVLASAAIMRYIHSPRDLRCAFRLRMLAESGGPSSRLRSRCGAVHTFGLGDHFWWQAQGKPRAFVAHSRHFVTGARDRSSFCVLISFWTWW